MVCIYSEHGSLMSQLFNSQVQYSVKNISETGFSKVSIQQKHFDAYFIYIFLQYLDWFDVPVDWFDVLVNWLVSTEGHEGFIT